MNSFRTFGTITRSFFCWAVTGYDRTRVRPTQVNPGGKESRSKEESSYALV